MTQVWLAVVAALLGLAIVFKLECLGLERDVAKLKEAHAIELKSISDAALAAQMSATQARDGKARAVADADAKHYGQLTEKNHEIDRLMADVDAGRKRLRLAAKCPDGTNDMPNASSPSGVVDGGTPELDPAARQHYRALRGGIERMTAQLNACRAYVRIVNGEAVASDYRALEAHRGAYHR